jgi:hypothetical protein
MLIANELDILQVVLVEERTEFVAHLSHDV